MDEEKKKEGMSVKEIEGYAKKNRFEVFFCLLFIFASLFGMLWWAVLSILLTGIGGIIGSLMPNKVENIFKKSCDAIFKQSGTTLLIVGIASLILSIIFAPVVFLCIGLYAGKSMLLHSKEISSHHEGGGTPPPPGQ